MAAQSGTETNHDGTTSDNTIVKMTGMAKHQNVMFTDQVDPYAYNMNSYTDSTRTLQDSDDATLQNFFRRPIKIAVNEWATSTTLGFDIDPWSLYFENPRVANRIANYNLLRCDLHVKFVINGNGFQYGRAIVSYLPFSAYDSLSSNAVLVRQDLVQASQQPHIFLDPTTSQGGEMTLPFFFYRNNIAIPRSRWGEMGTLYFRTLNALKHANGASDVVTISVFAWAENVKLSVLTSTESDTLLPQSGSEIDQANMNGMVSGPATTVARVASALTNIPSIAPFARATEIAANSTAAIAKSFGYCRPPVTRAPEPVKQNPVSSFALTNVPDTVHKLTVDDKQELTIDPRISGLDGTDPLSIREIAKRESYLTTFTWAIGTSTEALLWNARVDPCTWSQNSGPPVSYHFPACAMAALPFKYWTGSMRFRFQIVCSSFHKGRLKVVYDPNALSANEYNINYVNVIDIADQTDFTIEIANGQDRTLLEHALPGINSVTEMYSTTPYTGLEFFGNGVVGVYVVNELTTPNSTVNNDIEINVFVSMGDDFEVFVPDDHFQAFVFKPQSGMEMTIVSESQNTNEPSAPQHEGGMTLGPIIKVNSDINMVYTGEAISSFRTMLKRYNLWNAVGPVTNVQWVTAGRFSMFPYLRGNVADAVNTTGLGAPYNYCNTVLLHWVTNAFSGWRGSIRYKIAPRAFVDSTESIGISVQRHPKNETAYYRATGGTPAYVDDAEVSESVIIDKSLVIPAFPKPFSAVKGMTLNNGIMNPFLEFELPYYSYNRFTPGKEQSHTGTAIWNEGYDWRIECKGSAMTVFDFYVAAGEDYQAYFFTGLPRLYYEPTPPAP